MRRLFLAALLVLSSCTYGPVQEKYVFCQGVVSFGPQYSGIARKNSHDFALGLCYRRWRDPEGIAKYPDGGGAKELENRLTVYKCNADSRNCLELITIPGRENYIVGWLGQDILLRKGNDYFTIDEKKNLLPGTKEIPDASENPNGMDCTRSHFLDVRDDRGIVKLFVDRCGEYREKGDIELHLNEATGAFEWK